MAMGRVANLVFNIFAKTLGGEPQAVFSFPPLFIIGMLLFAQLIAVGTGLYPALRAVKVNPLDALRYE
jgi:ABC-type antimicrobial peptide transport system permease subunit